MSCPPNVRPQVLGVGQAAGFERLAGLEALRGALPPLGPSDTCCRIPEIVLQGTYQRPLLPSCERASTSDTATARHLGLVPNRKRGLE